MDDPIQALEEARRAGVDLDLLDSNLALSYEERWRRHDEALTLALKLRAAGLIGAIEMLTTKEIHAIAIRHGFKPDGT